MELDAKFIVDIVVAVFYFIGLMVAIFLPTIKSKSKKHNADSQEVVEFDKKIDKIAPVSSFAHVLMQLIIEAEQHTAYSAEDKLEYVVTKYHQFCIDNHIKFDDSIVVNCVDKLIALTKQVNKRDKDCIEPEVVDKEDAIVNESRFKEY